MKFKEIGYKIEKSFSNIPKSKRLTLIDDLSTYLSEEVLVKEVNLTDIRVSYADITAKGFDWHEQGLRGKIGINLHLRNEEAGLGLLKFFMKGYVKIDYNCTSDDALTKINDKAIKILNLLNNYEPFKDK